MRNKIIEQDLKEITKFNLPWKNFYGKTVLITGAAGMIAAYLVESLLYLNEASAKPKIKVLALVRDAKRAKQRFAEYKNRKDLEFVFNELSQPIKLKQRVDYIIHAASFASPKFYGSNPVGTIMPNVLGTHNILELARVKKVKGVLFVSSGEVYGDPGSKLKNLSEKDYGYLDPTNLRSCYGESKRLGETLCVSFWRQYGVPVKIVRLLHTYGPGMKLNDGRVFADFTANIVNNQDIVLNSDGKAIRAFCYLTDAAKGLFTVLLKGQNGEPYNLANPQAQISVIGLAKTLVKLFPEKKLKVVPMALTKQSGYLKSPVRKISPNIDKIKKLGWQPKVGIKQGFNKTIKSYL